MTRAPDRTPSATRDRLFERAAWRKLEFILVVRITHWVNVVALTIMIGSGLRIFNAYPAFARRGETFCCYPWEAPGDPERADVRRLARRRAQLALRDDVGPGRERSRLPRLHLPARRMARPGAAASIFRDALEMMKFYLFLRSDHPVQGKHNALQRGRISSCRSSASWRCSAESRSGSRCSLRR